MLAASASPERSTTLAFRDGLGDRFVSSDGATGAPVQVLRLRPDMTEVPAFEFALRERTARLATFRQEAYARVYRVHRMPAPVRDLAMISEHVEGLRLSALLRVAEQHHVSIDLSAALSVIRQLLQATSLLHGHAQDLANGLIAPERLIVTPRARVTIAEQALCVAIEQLHYSPERLWRELRIAAGPDTVRFSHRTDVLGIGLVALALVLGRPLRDEDFPHALPALLDAAREHSALGYERPLSAPLRDWMSCALQLEPNRAFASAPDAWRAFEQVVEADPLYLSVPMALERFLYSCTAALIQPSPLESSGAAPLPPVQSYPERAAAPEPILAAAVPSAHPADEPEIRVQMLPAPSIADTQGDSEPASDPIDWSALAGRPGSVVTARDITQLFSDQDPSSSDGDAGRFDAAGAPPPSWELPATAAEAERDRLPEAPADVAPEPAPIPETAPAALQSTIALTSWVERAAPLTSSSKWRRIAVAAALAGILTGSVVLNYFLRPETVAASEMGTVVVETNPEGLQVLIDGTDHGRTPARLSVQAGDHVLEVRGGGTPRILSFTVAGGAEVSHYIEFESEPQPQLRVGTAPAAAAPQNVTTPTASTSATPSWGWLDVKSAAPLEIRAGGRVLGRTGGERVRLAEGRHEIELVNDTGHRAVRVVHVVGGKVTNLSMPAPANGVVNVNAAPWAEVWIGGRRVGETPIANVSVPLGRHEVVFRHPELGEKRQTILVTAGAPLRISVDMK